MKYCTRTTGIYVLIPGWRRYGHSIELDLGFVCRGHLVAFFSPKVLFGEETVSCPVFQWTDQSGVRPLLRERTIFARRHLLRSHIKLSAKMGSAPNFISGKDKIPRYRRQISRKVISKLKAFQWETAHCVQTHSLSGLCPLSQDDGHRRRRLHRTRGGGHGVRTYSPNVMQNIREENQKRRA